MTTTRANTTLAGGRRTHALVDVAAMALLLAVGASSFGPVFSDASGYVAAGGGALLGLGLAVVSARLRWSGFTTVAAALAVFVAFGGALALPRTTVAGFVPTLETVNRLVLLTYQAWRDLLTVSVPAASFTGPAVVPYVTGLVCGLLAVTAALRARRHLWALAPALVLLLVGILWGTKVAPGASLQGALFCLVALAWATWRVARAERDDNAVLLPGSASNTSARRQRTLAAAAILAVAGGTAVGVGGPLANATDRYVLRDDVVPPLDLRAYASPLTQFRRYERALKEKTLFTVTGLPTDARVRLAAMDGYDGHVFSVDSTAAQFLRVGERIGVEELEGARTLRFEIGEYQGVWLPGGGEVGGVRFADGSNGPTAAGLHYSDDSGTLLTTASVSDGAAYEVTWQAPTTPSDQVLAKDSVATTMAVGGVDVPAAVAGISSEFVEPGESQIDQLRQLEAKFREVGFFSSDDAVSLSGHYDGRLTKMFSESRMVGDDEQYAVAMALMVRQLGYPARVVMGFYPEENPGTGPLAITGNDAHVWVEVPFEKAGWVAFDPTPDRDKTPDTKVPRPDEVPRPQVLPPPVPPEEPIEPPDDQTDESRSQSKEDGPNPVVDAIGKALLYVGGGALVVSPFALVLLLKARRRAARRLTGRTADRISGGWSEVLDTAADLGVRTPPRLTRQETARVLGTELETAGAVAVAERVDSHVFGEAEPATEDVDRMWGEVDVLLRDMRGRAKPVRRVLALFSPRSLFTGQGRLRMPERARVGRIVRTLPRRVLPSRTSPRRKP